PAGVDRAAEIACCAHVTVHLVEMGAAGEGAVRGFGIERIADEPPLRARGKPLHEVLEDRPLDQHAAAAEADLPLIAECCARSFVERPVKIGIFEDNEWVLPA